MKRAVVLARWGEPFPGVKPTRWTLEPLAKAVTIARRSGFRVAGARAWQKILVALDDRFYPARSVWALRYADVRSRIGPARPRSCAAARVSIIVVDAVNRRAVARTLRSLAAARSVLPLEIVIGPSRDTPASINERVAAAQGTYTLIVRAGIVVTASALQTLMGLLEREPYAGAAVPKIVDGAWRPTRDDLAMSFSRSADISAHMTLFRTVLWRESGGLDERLPLAEALIDLTNRLRVRERDTVYRPDALVLTTVPQKAERAATPVSPKTILVVDEFVPRDDRDAGSKRLVALLRLMRSLGYAVIFVPDQPGSPFASSRLLREIGCDVRTHEGDASSVLRTVTADVAWLSRPQIGERYADLLRAAGTRCVVYDTVDLHYLRLAREEALFGTTNGWETVREKELALIRAADATVVTSRHEQALLRELGMDSVVIPVIAEPPKSIAPFEAREGLLFVGNFTHAPNVDALARLAEIVPRLRERIPGVHLDVVGFDPDGIAPRFAQRGLRVHGHVASLDRYYERARLLLAPLRFGAGAKGKIVESLAYGLPVVTTPIGAEGLGDEAERAMLIAEHPQEWAEQVVRAYTDERMWSSLSAAARRAAQGFSREAVRPVLADLLESVTNAGATA